MVIPSALGGSVPGGRGGGTAFAAPARAGEDSRQGAVLLPFSIERLFVSFFQLTLGNPAEVSYQQ
jgi:hypothetical protein